MKMAEIIIIGFLGSLVLIVFITLILVDYYGKAKFRFSRAFGIFPNYEAEPGRRIRQKIINETLTERAQHYYEEDTAERSLYELLQKQEGEKDKQKAIKECKRLEKLIFRQGSRTEKAKKKFWRAHLLARVFNYEVKEKYTDYLDYLPSAANRRG